MEKEFPNSDFHELRTEFVKRIKDFFPDGGNEKKIFKWIISISRYFDAKRKKKKYQKNLRVNWITNILKIKEEEF